MLVTDVGDEMCWLQDLDVGDKSRYQHRELGTNIKYQSPASLSPFPRNYVSIYFDFLTNFKRQDQVLIK